jgi:hypothetical protein
MARVREQFREDLPCRGRAILDGRGNSRDRAGVSGENFGYRDTVSSVSSDAIA